MFVRTSDKVLRCDATAVGPGATSVPLDRCVAEAPADSTAKGPAGPMRPPYHFSLVLGLGGFRDDGYTDRLEEFGYGSQKLVAEHVALGGLYRVHHNVLVGGQVALLGGQEWQRATTMQPLNQKWSTYTAGGVGRVELGETFVGYAQLGAGLAVTHERFSDQDGDSTSDAHAGVYVDGALGVDWMFGDSWGVTVRSTASFSPSLPNLIGDRHDAGLFGFDLGVVFLR